MSVWFPVTTTAALLSTPFVVTIFLVGHMVVTAPLVPCPVGCDCFEDKERLLNAKCSLEKFAVNPMDDFFSIQYLSFNNSNPQGRVSLKDEMFRAFSGVITIEMVNCSVGYIYPGAFKGLKFLEELDLSHNHITHFQQSSFIYTPKLSYLNLNNNPIELTDFFLNSRSLHELKLESCSIQYIPAGTFKGLPKLRGLSLYNNSLDTIPPHAMPRSLKKLNLASNRIINVPTEEIYNLNRIRIIDLSENPINCSCKLMGLQDWLSGRGVIFENDVFCSSPPQYHGKNWNTVSEDEICEEEIRLTDGQENNVLSRSRSIKADCDDMRGSCHEPDDFFQADQPLMKSETEKTSTDTSVQNDETKVEDATTEESAAKKEEEKDGKLEQAKDNDELSKEEVGEHEKDKNVHESEISGETVDELAEKEASNGEEPQTESSLEQTVENEDTLEKKSHEEHTGNELTDNGSVTKETEVSENPVSGEKNNQESHVVEKVDQSSVSGITSQPEENLKENEPFTESPSNSEQTMTHEEPSKTADVEVSKLAPGENEVKNVEESGNNLIEGRNLLPETTTYPHDESSMAEKMSTAAPTDVIIETPVSSVAPESSSVNSIDSAATGNMEIITSEKPPETISELQNSLAPSTSETILPATKTTSETDGAHELSSPKPVTDGIPVAEETSETNSDTTTVPSMPSETNSETTPVPSMSSETYSDTTPVPSMSSETNLDTTPVPSMSSETIFSSYETTPVVVSDSTFPTSDFTPTPSSSSLAPETTSSTEILSSLAGNSEVSSSTTIATGSEDVTTVKVPETSSESNILKSSSEIPSSSEAPASVSSTENDNVVTSVLTDTSSTEKTPSSSSESIILPEVQSSLGTLSPTADESKSSTESVLSSIFSSSGNIKTSTDENNETAVIASDHPHEPTINRSVMHAVKENIGSYIVLGCIVSLLAILALIALMRCKKVPSKKRVSRSDSEVNNGTELQEITSLIPSSMTNGSKIFNGKYPNEKSSKEAVNLLSPAEEKESNGIIIPLHGDSNATDAVGNNNEHWSNGRQNGKSCNGVNKPDNPSVVASISDRGSQFFNDGTNPAIELTKVRVMMLPDSVPKTPIFVHRNNYGNEKS